MTQQAKVFKYAVISTLSASVRYAMYAPKSNAKGAPPVLLGSVVIAGGAGVADKRGDTVAGVKTKITEEEKSYLDADPVFKKHAQGGFVQIVALDADEEAAAADMASRDGSSPATPSDYVADNANAPTTNGPGTDGTQGGVKDDTPTTDDGSNKTSGKTTKK